MIDIKILVPARFLLNLFCGENFILCIPCSCSVNEQQVDKKLDIYPRISFTNKGLSIVQRLHVRYDVVQVFYYGVASYQ